MIQLYDFGFSRHRFRDARVKLTPRIKDDYYFQNQGAPRFQKYMGGWLFHITDPPKHAGSGTSLHKGQREVCAAVAVCVGMNIFLSSAGASSTISWQEAMRRTYMHDKGACHFRAPEPVRAVDAWFLRSRHWGGKLRAAESITSSIIEAEAHSRFEEV